MGVFHGCNSSSWAVESVDSRQRLEVFVASLCATCGKDSLSRPLCKGGPNECESCRDYRKRRGTQRPGQLIARAAKRREQKASGLTRVSDFDMDSGEFTARNFINTAPLEPIKCSCGCGRLADTYKTTDGLAKVCRDLRYHRSQRSAA